MAVNEAGQVDYRDVINSLNWRQRAVLPPAGATAVGAGPGSGSTWQGNDASSQSQLVQVVRVDALMQDMSA